MRRAITTLVAMGITACAPPVTRREIREGPGVSRAELRPSVIERSGPVAPIWIERVESPSGGARAFAGAGAGLSLDAARAAAHQDLLGAISSFVAVDVTSGFEDRMVSSTGAGGAQEIQTVQSSLTVRSSSSLEGISPDEDYWEHIIPSRLLPERSTYRFHVHAVVPEAELVRARRHRLDERAKATETRTLAVLPFRAVLDGRDSRGFLPLALAEELEVQAKRGAQVRVLDGAAIRSVIARAAPGDSDRIRRVQDALLPDWVVTGGYQRDGERIEVTVRLTDGRDGRVAGVWVQSDEYGALARLQHQLTRAVLASFTSTAAMPSPAERAPDVGIEAFETYHQALALSSAGAHELALQKIARAIELRPDDPRPLIRSGRILERMGRFGKLPPSAAVTRERAEDLALCTERGQAAARTAATWIAERAARLSAPVSDAQPAWWADALNVDHVLSAAERFVHYAAPGSRVPPEANAGHIMLDQLLGQRGAPTSAVEAYARALTTAAVAGNIPAEVESTLALAELALRVDRMPSAHRQFVRVYQDAVGRGDLDAQSRALLGRGIAHRRAGHLTDAWALLNAALELRARLAERPALLEVLNELGGVLLELGQPSAAELAYERARRLARELQSDYLGAVLDNNVGVLEYQGGRVASAERRFESARDYLRAARESEGAVVSALNVTRAAIARADLDEADASLAWASRAIVETGQEGRLGDVEALRGALALARSDAATALPALAKATLFARGLGRSAEALRLQNDLYAAEWTIGAGERGVVECLKDQLGRLSAVRVQPRARHRARQWTITQVGTLPARELAVTHNAFVAASLAEYPRDWRGRSRAEPPPVAPKPPPRPVESWMPASRRPPGWEEAPDRPTGPEVADELAVRQPAAVPRDDSERDVEVVLQGTAVSGSLTKVEEDKLEAARTPVEQERILGAFLIGVDVLAFIDPKLADDIGDGPAADAARDALTALAERAALLQLPRLEATARLNLAALSWLDRSPEAAYQDAVRAERAFAMLGDVDGLARSLEWLGWMFLQSRDAERAAEHLSLAHQLFEEAGDEAAAARILSYGGD